MITRLPKNTKNGFYKCLDLHLKLREEKQIARSLNVIITDDWVSWKIKKIRQNISDEPYFSLFGPINISTVDQIEEKCKIRLVIWTKKSRRDPLRIGFESKHAGTPTTDFHLFSECFDRYTNPVMDHNAVILNIGAFTKKYKYSALDNSMPFRSVTLFQALVLELHPKIVGTEFEEKVQSYRRKWVKPNLYLADIHEFYSGIVCSCFLIYCILFCITDFETP